MSSYIASSDCNVYAKNLGHQALLDPRKGEVFGAYTIFRPTIDDLQRSRGSRTSTISSPKEILAVPDALS